MDIEVKLSKGKIILRAKDDTYLAVRTYLASHDSNANSKYEMQADERNTHERKLLNSVGSSLSKLKSELNRYRISDTLTEEKDSFELTFEMSDRIDLSKAKDVERLVEEYLYRSVVADWWLVNYPEAAASYQLSADSVLADLNKCFTLMLPFDGIDGVRYKCLCKRDYRIVLLYKEELLNEIHTELLKLSRSRSNEKGIPDLNLETSELKDESLLTRYINRHVGRICSRVNAYLYELSNSVDNDRMDRLPVYEFKLIFPRNWDDRLFEQLAEEMHAYVVNASITEWLKSYLPDTASVYGSQADSAWDNMKHIVSVRRNGVRKPIQPF